MSKRPLESWTYTAAGKAKRVPIFPTEKHALRAFAANLRDKTAHKVFIIRWDELHEVDLLPARGGQRHAIMDGIRIKVNKGDWTWAEVVTLTGGIYVGGDIETVVFQGGGDRAHWPRGRVYWMATRSYGYAREKARHGGTARDEWDEECARGDILWHRRLGQLEKEAARELWDLLKRGDVGNHELAAATYEATKDAELCDLGVVTNKSVYMATAVLRRLAYLFDCEGFRASSHEWFGRAA